MFLIFFLNNELRFTCYGSTVVTTDDVAKPDTCIFVAATCTVYVVKYMYELSQKANLTVRPG